FGAQQQRLGQGSPHRFGRGGEGRGKIAHGGQFQGELAPKPPPDASARRRSGPGAPSLASPPPITSSPLPSVEPAAPRGDGQAPAPSLASPPPITSSPPPRRRARRPSVEPVSHTGEPASPSQPSSP